MGCDTCGSGASDSDPDCAPAADSFRAFYQDLLDLIRRHSDGPNGAPIRLRYDPSYDIIRLTGPGATARAKAIDGLADVMELALSTAEHHPYWGLLYYSADVADTVLQKWDGDSDAGDSDGDSDADPKRGSPGSARRDRGLLSDADADSIAWSLQEMKSALGGATGRGADC